MRRGWQLTPVAQKICCLQLKWGSTLGREWKQKWTKTDWRSSLTEHSAPAVLRCCGRERVELEGTALHLSVDLWPSSLVWAVGTDQKTTVARKPTMYLHHLPPSSNVLMFTYTKNPQNKRTSNNMSDLTVQTFSRIQKWPHEASRCLNTHLCSCE